MKDIIQQIDYHDRNNKGKKAWAIAYDRIYKQEIEELTNNKE